MASTPKINEELADDILYAARYADSELLEESLQTLFTSHADVLKPDLIRAVQDEYSGNTPLHMAAANGHIDIIKTLLSYFSKPTDKPSAPSNIKNNSGNTPLHYAGINGHLEIAKLLFNDWAGDIGIQNESGKSVLTEAAVAEKDEVVQWCLEVWDDIEKADADEKVADTTPDEVAEDLQKAEVGEGSSNSR